ncbi:MAG: M28 family metallopeptidase [Desulfococcaceae bacterium]|jgi:Zn-dependent M28 family amino/carboxypeptidase|nr:M28 family metallopeptidase [Desulfococcaceae bacterium]
MKAEKWKKTDFGLCFLFLTLLLFCSCSSSDSDPVVISPEDGIEHAMTAEALTGHLQELEKGAVSGNRAAGTQGYDNSVHYIRSLLADSGLLLWEQEVNFRFFEENREPVMHQLFPRPADYAAGMDFSTMTYSGSGDVTGELAFVTPMIPPGADPNSSDDACESADFDGIDLNGKIAVIQRGGCSYEEKALNAQNRGAAAVLIFNEGQIGRTETIRGTLGEDAAISIPVLGITYELGQEFCELAQAGTVSAGLIADSIDEDRNAVSLFAETSGGDSSQVIMAGAHLDSVSAGPGINDNGSGAAALTELAYQVAALGYEPQNKIRFAWWTAKEAGNAGSQYYTENLSDADYYSIAMYLDADSIASPNHVFAVLDSDLSDTGDEDNLFLDPDFMPAGSGEIEAAFTDYFASCGIRPKISGLHAETDYNAFVNIGIPVGGLSAGEDGIKSEEEAGIFGGNAGEPYDPCYHQFCDDTANINEDALLRNAKALTHVVQYFADQETVFGDTGTLVRRSADRTAKLAVKNASGYDRSHSDRHVRSAR